MRSIRSLFACVALGTVALSAAANTDTFANGQSFYGTPAMQPSAARVVDLTTAKHLNVAYGETVTFRNEGKEFSWTFNGLDRQGVSLAKIAPAGFTSKPFSVYVAQNPLTRR